MKRHRASLQDLGVLALVLAVATFYAWQVDVFVGERALDAHERRIDLNEALLLGALMVFGLLVFAIRRYLAQGREMQRRVAAEHRARELALQDALTGLPNRRQFDDALAAAVAAPPASGAVHAVFLLDLNGFKRVNDLHGHSIGDEVLVAVAQRLLGVLRDGDLAARFGGDEFAILARHLIGPEAATTIALRVLQALEPPIATGALRHCVGAGIGIALVPQDAANASEALRKADVALYRAKAERRSSLRFFEAQMDRQVEERHAFEQALHAAVRAGAIETRFRPYVDIATGEIVGVEAAPHWQDPVFGRVPRERFVPPAEETGLIHELQAGVLAAAAAAAGRWPENLTLTLELYPSQLKDATVAARILTRLEAAGIAAQRVEIGITESALVHDLDAASRVLGQLRAGGVRIVLSEFGTGYSSLYHLRNFRLDKIKIDRGFVATMTSAPDTHAIVNALIGLGQGLGLTVAADGVDDANQRGLLLEAGCRQAEGALFGEPLAAADLQCLLATSAGRVQGGSRRGPRAGKAA